MTQVHCSRMAQVNKDFKVISAYTYRKYDYKVDDASIFLFSPSPASVVCSTVSGSTSNNNEKGSKHDDDKNRQVKHQFKCGEDMNWGTFS